MLLLYTYNIKRIGLQLISLWTQMRIQLCSLLHCVSTALLCIKILFCSYSFDPYTVLFYTVHQDELLNKYFLSNPFVFYTLCHNSEYSYYIYQDQPSTAPPLLHWSCKYHRPNMYLSLYLYLYLYLYLNYTLCTILCIRMQRSTGPRAELLISRANAHHRGGPSLMPPIQKDE